MKIVRINHIRGIIDPVDLQTVPKEFNYKLLTLFKQTTYVKGRKTEVSYYEDREHSQLVIQKSLTDELDDLGRLNEIKINLKWAFMDGSLSDDTKEMYVALTPEESDQQLIKRRKRIVSKLRRDAAGTPI